MDETRLTGTEKRAAASLAGIFGLRMFGLFMLYPVFASYARVLPGATAVLIGIALGIYGLTQAGLQLPFGLASDRLGRKPIITLGLVLFAAGSVVAALARNIDWIIIGRAVQGAGAVGAATLALTADLTRVEQRTKAIGIIGMGIGLAFGLALVAGPVVNAWLGLAGIFWLTAALGLVGIVVLWTTVPTPAVSRRHSANEPVPALIGRVLRDVQLVRLYGSIFALHAMLAALFLAIPLLLQQVPALTARNEWMFYLPVLAVGLLLMLPLVIYAEARRQLKPVALGAILILAATAFTLGFMPIGLFPLAVVLAVFFAAFTLMEALLPSLVSRLARPEAKGTALGVYSTAQFFGIFVGGALGGWIHGRFGIPGVCVFVAAVGLLWATLFATLRPPRALSSRTLEIGVCGDEEARRLAARLETIAGVEEAVVFGDEGMASLRVDRARLDEAALAQATAKE
ncbi:MAG: MFS transporter [Gammaproteobacteria bacterium]